jgi:hypothetical protein
MDFDHVPVWIQLWGLPPHCKTKAMGTHLGSLTGEVEASEFYEYPGKKVIIKIKVAMNVHLPIPSGIYVGNPTDGTSWVDFRYEKLPQVCFRCGIIGHSDKLCHNQALNMETVAPLGPWIRSAQYGRRKMEERDKKYCNNPSHSPNFGKYNPLVPAELLAQLEAMKIRTQHPKEDCQQQAQNMTDNYTKNQDSTPQEEGQLMEKGYGIGGQPIWAEGTTMRETRNQTKRLKTTTTSTDCTIQPMAGLEFQASQQP